MLLQYQFSRIYKSGKLKKERMNDLKIMKELFCRSSIQINNIYQIYQISLQNLGIERKYMRKALDTVKYQKRNEKKSRQTLM